MSMIKRLGGVYGMMAILSTLSAHAQPGLPLGPTVAPIQNSLIDAHVLPAFGPLILSPVPERPVWSVPPYKARNMVQAVTLFSSMDARPEAAKIAILIDDLGYNRRGMEASLALPNEVALAILPHTPFAVMTAKSAKLTHRITLLHAPMENERALDLGPGGLYASMQKQQYQQTLRDNLAAIPYIKGVNNHMGSLLTQQVRNMQWTMEVVAQERLFFVDSLTSPKSVAFQQAQAQGIATHKRDVFLDNIPTEAAIARQFERLLQLARQQGAALAIGHPYPQTTQYLSQRLQQWGNEGVQLVPITDILLYPSGN